jgi:hypothetical protein
MQDTYLNEKKHYMLTHVCTAWGIVLCMKNWLAGVPKPTHGTWHASASMIKGGGYVGVRTRQHSTAQTHTRKSSVGQGGCVPWHPRPTPWLLWFKLLVLQCIICFKCRCISDGEFIQFMC